MRLLDKERDRGGRNQFKRERGPHKHVLLIGPRGQREFVEPGKAERLIQKEGWQVVRRKD